MKTLFLPKNQRNYCQDFCPLIILTIVLLVLGRNDSFIKSFCFLLTFTPPLLSDLPTALSSIWKQGSHIVRSLKVQIIWESQRNLTQSLTLFWHYVLSNLKKKKWDVFSNFVAFPQYLNFKTHTLRPQKRKSTFPLWFYKHQQHVKLLALNISPSAAGLCSIIKNLNKALFFLLSMPDKDHLARPSKPLWFDGHGRYRTEHQQHDEIHVGLEKQVAKSQRPVKHCREFA